ncbi:MAG: AAA family ATPase [Bryobacteraceae bacterium]
MICVGNTVPIGRGVNAVEFCHSHFEPPERAGGARPAFALHALGLDPEDQSAAFVLTPAAGDAPEYWFVARWGRTGVGGKSFMPVPAQLEDDRPGIEIYGYKATNFNWRSCQWEISQVVEPFRFDVGSRNGEQVELPANAGSAYAFRDGAPVADLDAMEPGEYPETGIAKEEERPGESYVVRFGGRVWRRRLKTEPPIERVGFDPRSGDLQNALGEVWGEIGGQEEAKRELIRAIQWPVLYPELFRLFKRRRSRGVLLYGPPGCGKTLLGKAVVRLLAALYQRRADDGGFKYVKGHQLLDMYLGQSEKAVKALFDDARRWREERGYPAVLFFDEADALFQRRPGGTANNGFTLVPALLAEMDGMDESGAFVILATNRPDALDVAITRPGRIDRRIRVTRPDREASASIFRIHLQGVFLDEGVTAEELSAFAAEELFSASHRLYEVSIDGARGKARGEFLLKDLASGAVIQNIVDRATANKMEYCIERGVAVGLRGDDIRRAVEEACAEQRQAQHDEELGEFAELSGGRLAGWSAAE